MKQKPFNDSKSQTADFSQSFCVIAVKGRVVNYIYLPEEAQMKNVIKNYTAEGYTCTTEIKK